MFNRLDTTFSFALPAIVTVVAAMFSIPSCAVQGDRAQNGCPPGETCSGYTPNGLSLRGKDKADELFNSTSPTASGGTQTFRIFDEFDGGALDIPFYVATNGCMDVASVDGNRVTLAATDACSTTVEFRHPQNDLLFDRFTLSSATVERTFVINTIGDRFANEAASDPLYGTDEIHPPFLNSAERVLGVGLLGAGLRVVDEGLDVAEMTPDSSWDTFHGVLSDENLEVTLSSGVQLDAPIRNVDSIDRIEEIIIDDEGDDDDENRVHCFEGFAGTEGVLAVPFEFTTDGPDIRVAPFVLSTRCASVTFVADSSGQSHDANLIVAGGGHEITMLLSAPVETAQRWTLEGADRNSASAFVPGHLGIRGERARTSARLDQ